MSIAYRTLLAFPYYSNYVDLVNLELNAISSAVPAYSARNFAVIGSGPLPLTSLLISRALSSGVQGCITCTNIDHDPQAIATSLTLCHALKINQDTVCFQCAEACSDVLDLASFDVVYLAALVGQCGQQKRHILSSLVKRMRPGALVVLRSAHSLRRLVYPVSICANREVPDKTHKGRP